MTYFYIILFSVISVPLYHLFILHSKEQEEYIDFSNHQLQQNCITNTEPRVGYKSYEDFYIIKN